MSTLPSWPSLKTWFPPLSASQRFPSRSTASLCGLINIPAPNVFSSLPDLSNWKIGLTFALGPAQVVPPAPELPQRSVTQIVSSGAVVTLAVDPHFRPSGNRPQLTPGRYGLGRSLRAPRSDTAGSRTGYWPAGKTGVARATGAAARGT